MNEAGVTRQYKDLVGRYETIPFVKKESFDLDQYVVTKALDGLFYMVGEEEKKIRKNPAARTTELLKEVRCREWMDSKYSRTCLPSLFRR